MTSARPAVAAGRGAGQVVGTLEKRGRFLAVTPLFPRRGEARGALAVDPRGGAARDARPGDVVLVRFSAGRRGRGMVVRRIGRPDVARDVIEALMVDRGLARRFPAAIERAAAEPPAEAPHRHDLRDLPTLTIDPASARDFDDAISARELAPGRWQIWVHIADVSAHVRPGAPLDREAERRGTSVYVPGAVEPMLPPALSNRACSLVPGEDRLAVTVELELAGAEVVRAAFMRSTIRSDARLDYDGVDRIFAGRERAHEPWAASLAAARAAAAALEARRAERGALAIESAEPQFDFDADGHVTGVHASVQTESHRLIEHLMIAANEQVARLLSAQRVPTLYRVHERPDPAAIRRLADQLASLDVPTPPVSDHMTSHEAEALIVELSRAVGREVERRGRGRAALTSLVLRSLKQAHYAPQSLGHSGLGSTHYCHFTSPIRRYPDLVCHRALLSAVAGGEQAPRAGGLEEAGAWASERERDALALERDADDVARCFLLERALYEQGWEQDFEGEVVGLIPAGAFIAFGDAPDGAPGAYEGFLPVRRLRGDWWELNEAGTILLGSREGGTIRLGDPIRVTVGRVEAPRGRVDLYPFGA